jgi:hypothetical protein
MLAIKAKEKTAPIKSTNGPTTMTPSSNAIIATQFLLLGGASVEAKGSATWFWFRSVDIGVFVFS